METGPAARRFDEGYRDGYAACLNAGSSVSAHLILETRRRRDEAYDAGFEWALYDYDDANGLPTLTHVAQLVRGRTAQ